MFVALRQKRSNVYSFDRLVFEGLVFGFLYLSLYFVSSYIESDLPIATVVVYSVFLLSLFSRRLFFFKYLWIIFTMSWIVIADAILVGTHMWLYELQTATFSNGSLLPLAAGFSLMLYCVLLLEGRKLSRQKCAALCLENRRFCCTRAQITIARGIGIGALLIIVACFILVAAHPAWLNGRDRFDYAANYLPAVLAANQQYLILLIPLSFPCWKVGSKEVFYSVIVFYIFYLVWTGEKFTSLFLLFYILLLAIAVPRLHAISPQHVRQLSSRAACVSAAILFACLALVLIQYSRQFGPGEAISMLQQRIASQGEVWWGIYGYSSTKGPFISELGDELATFFTVGDSSAVLYGGGMWKLMQIIMTPRYYAMYVANATRLSSSTPATLYYYFGYFGLVLGLIVLAGAYYLVVNRTIVSLEKSRILESTLCVYLIKIMHGVLIMSDFNTLFSWKTLAAFLCLLVIDVAKIKHVGMRLPRAWSVGE